MHRCPISSHGWGMPKHQWLNCADCFR